MSVPAQILDTERPDAAALDFSSLRIAVVVNTASGSTTDASAVAIEKILSQAGIDAELRIVHSDTIAENFEKIADEAPDLLIILGGDGTIRCGAEKCGGAVKYLIPLPGGTMNMLPKALYGSRKWEDALAETLANPKAQDVSGGIVETHRFYCAGIFGSPSLWREAREAIRENKFILALRWASYAFRKSFSRKVRFDFGKVAGRAAAVSAICPLVSAQLDDDDRTLEAAALALDNAAQAFGLALTAAFSDWRQDANVVVTRTRAIRITSRGSIPAILDGEMVRLGRQTEIGFVPKAFTALVPAQSQS